jgi:hypothetical protein
MNRGCCSHVDLVGISVGVGEAIPSGRSAPGQRTIISLENGKPDCSLGNLTRLQDVRHPQGDAS